MSKASRNRQREREKYTAWTSRISPGDSLRWYAIDKALTFDRRVDAMFHIHKGSWLNNGLTLAKDDGARYVVVTSLQQPKEAALVDDYMARNPSAAERLPEQPTPGIGFAPWGQVFDREVGDVVTARVVADDDIRESIAETLAGRMAADPDGDYIFSNLTPEELADVERRKARKPQ